ncbi:glycosyltransferase family 4 protein [Catenovulum sp. SX2]|uniref:glycosyltransferase family 4 protein n=1 Tax=Catenovulum sp. SX2 TaxID=3398614 RepID=UPI003F87A09A
MKILFVNTLFDPIVIGGAEKSLKNLILALVKYKKIDPIVVTLNNEHQDKIEYVDGIKVYRLDHRNSRFIFDDSHNKINKTIWHIKEFDNKKFSPIFSKIFNYEKPDLIHTNNLLGFSSIPLLVAQQTKIPVIHTIRDYYFQCYQSSKFKRGNSCEKMCVACQCQSSKRRARSQLVKTVVGNSRYILDDHLREGIFTDAVNKEVVYNINDSPLSNPVKPYPKNRVIKLGYIGRLHTSKGIVELVKLLKNNSKYQLLIAGKGDAEATIQKEIQSSNNISLLGYVSPEVLFKQIDVLIMPSLWHEPLARTIYEAYAFGIPVIASDTGGSPEIIFPGKTGYIFDPIDFSQIPALLTKVFSDEQHYQLMSKACLSYSQEFRSEAISEKYYDLYRTTLHE